MCDDSGKVLLSAWGRIGKCSSPMVAEALACLKGTKAIISEVHLPVQIEPDCARLVAELTAKDSTKSEILFIVPDANHLLNSLQDWRISKVNRTGNQAAHALASFSRKSGSDGVLLGMVPTCVEDIVLFDCNEPCNPNTLI